MPEMSLGEIAQHLGAALSGGAETPIRGIAGLGQAGADQISWVADQKHAGQAAQSHAAALVTPTDLELKTQRPLLRVDDVELAVCRLLALLGPPQPRVSGGVHPSAIIEAGAEIDATAAVGPQVYVGTCAKIGRGAQLHAGVYIGAESSIGADCVLWPNVVVRERVRIGDRVIIHPNATIGADGFGFIFRAGTHQKVPQIGTVEIEDDVEIGANTCVDRAKTGVTRIGAGTKIDNLVQIAHNVTVGRHSIIVAQCGISGSCSLGNHVVLGGQVGLADHVSLGDGTQVAAQSGVVRNLAGPGRFGGGPAVELTTYARQITLFQRLPELAAQLRDLGKRIAQLESSANDRKGS